MPWKRASIPARRNRSDFIFPPVKVDRVVKDGEVIELGGVKMTAHVTAGIPRAAPAGPGR